MKLLFISNMYPPFDMGGYEQWCQEIALLLQQKGHDVHILTSRYGVEHGQAVIEENVTRTLFLETDPFHYKPFDFLLNWQRQQKANQQELHRVLDQLKPDVALVWGMWLLSHNIPYWLEQQMPDRVAYYLASYWPVDNDPHISYWQLAANKMIFKIVKEFVNVWIRKNLRQANYPPQLKFKHVASCTKYVHNQLLLTRTISDDAKIIYGGIDPIPFYGEDIRQTTRESSDQLRLLYFGTLREGKGVHTALEALGHLKKRNLLQNIHLTFLGDGDSDYKTHLFALAKELDIEESVNFAGRVPRAEIPYWLNQFDVFLFTSLWPEPFGRTIVEAMAAGLVVIGSDVGGSREIFRHYPENMLYQPGNAEELASQIQRLFEEPELLSRLAKIGPKLVSEQFTLERMANEIEAWLGYIAHENLAHQ